MGWTRAIGIAVVWGALSATACSRSTCRLDADCPATQVCAADASGQFSTCVDKSLAGCRSDSDCTRDQRCEPDSRKCVAVTCDKDCGAGFVCVLTSAGPSCAIDPTAPAAATLSGVTPGAYVGGPSSPASVSCAVTAKQLGAVTLYLGTASQSMTASGASGSYSADVDFSSSTVPEGPLSLKCEAQFGPAAATQKIASDSVVVFVDHTPPTVTLEPVDSWVPPAASLTISALITDGGPAGSGLATDAVHLKATSGSYEVAGSPAGGSLWEFTVTPASMGSPGADGKTHFTVDATDRAGNKATATGALSVDGAAPTISNVVAPTGWLRPAEGPVAVQATIAATGAPVDPSSVLLTANGKTFPGSAGSSGLWTFEVDPAAVGSDSSEQAVPFTIDAQDVAGNAAPPGHGSLNLDGKQPSITMTAPAGSHGPNTPVPVTVMVADGGSGVDPSSVEVVAAGLEASCTGSASPFSCPVPTAGARISGPLPFTVFASDKAGNSATSTSTLTVDVMPPAITITPDRTWYGGNSTVSVKVTVTDDSAGVDSSSVAVNGQASSCTGSGGSFVCTVSTASAPPNAVTPNFGFTITAADFVDNTSTANGTLRVDTAGPAISVAPDSNWYGRGATIAVTAIVTDSGVGMVSAPRVTLTATDSSATGHTAYVGLPAGGGQFVFTVTPGDFMPSGRTFTNFALQLAASDALGNSSTQPFSLHLDDTPPTVSANTDVSWHGMTQSFPITITAQDPGGSGPATADLSVIDPSGNVKKTWTASRSGTGTFVFSIDPSTFFPLNVTANDVQFEVTATDAVGKTSLPFGFFRKLDSEPPTLTVQTPTAPVSLGVPVTIMATVTDAGAGVKGVDLSYPTVSGTRTVPGTSVGGSLWSWAFDGSGVFPTTNDSTVTLTFTAADTVGNNSNPQSAGVTVTRKLWEYKLAGSTQPFVAYADGTTYVTTGPAAFAIGSHPWSAAPNSTVLTSPPVLGTKYLYAAYSTTGPTSGVQEYGVAAIDRTTGPDAAGNPAWMCPLPSPSGGQPVYDLAIGQVDWGDGSKQETVFAVANGQLVALHESSTAGGCVSSVSGFINVADYTSIALAADPVAGERVWYMTAQNQVGYALFSGGAWSQAFVGQVRPVTFSLSLAGPNAAFCVQGQQVNEWSGASANTTWTSSNIPDTTSTSESGFPVTLATPSLLYLTAWTNLGTYLLGYVPGSNNPPLKVVLPGSSWGPPTIDANGNLLVATNGTANTSAALTSYDATGVQRWQFQIAPLTSGQAIALSSPLLTCQGTYLVRTTDGRVIAIAGDGVGLKPGAWPVAAHDDKNTADFDTPLVDSRGTCVDQ